MDVSIVIVSWNTKKLLKSTLASLYRTIRDVSFEVIVVDNESSDGSPEMVEDEFPQAVLIQTGANLGFGRANNVGIRRSLGRYLCLVNSDVEVYEGAIDRMVSYMDSNAMIGMLGPRTLNPDGTLQHSYEGRPTPWRLFCRSFSIDRLFPKSRLFAGSLMNWFSGEKTIPVDILYGSCWLIRREALDQVGLLDEHFFMYSEDKDWCRRFHDAGWGVVYYADAEIVHYGGGSSSQAPIRYYIAMLRANLQYWRKHHGIAGYLYIFIVRLVAAILYMTVWRIMQFLRPGSRANSRYKGDRNAAVVKTLLGIAMQFTGRLAAVGVSLVCLLMQTAIRALLAPIRLYPATAVILKYEAVTAEKSDRFARQMDGLLKAAHPVDARLEQGIVSGAHHAAVTFDGGFSCIRENAITVLADRGIPTAIFVATAYIGKRPGWITDLLDSNRLEPIMTTEDLHGLAIGNVEIGSLTHTHRALMALTTDEVTSELAESWRILSEAVGRNIDQIAVPFGEYDDTIIEYAKSAGYRFLYDMVPSFPGIVGNKSQFVWGRTSCSPDDWSIEFYLKVRGAYLWLAIVDALKRLVRPMFSADGDETGSTAIK